MHLNSSEVTKGVSKVQNPHETAINLAFPVHVAMLIPLIKEKYRKAGTQNEKYYGLVSAGFS